MCEQLGVSRSGYYKWKTAKTSTHDTNDQTLRQLVAEIHQDCNKPGWRRIRAELHTQGWRVGPRRVRRLMRELGLSGRHTPWKKTTIQAAQPVEAPDLVSRDFSALGPNTTWCGDITYVKTWNGWAYLATVIDLWSRKLVGWAVAGHMDRSLVIAALQHAIDNRKPITPVVFHSDRGSQYTSKDFAVFCENNGVVRSLGRTGSCFDNSVSESFNATLKKELIHTRPWPDVDYLNRHIFEWVETQYNKRRRHSYLGYLTIEEYELGYRSLDEIAIAKTA